MSMFNLPTRDYIGLEHEIPELKFIPHKLKRYLLSLRSHYYITDAPLKECHFFENNLPLFLLHDQRPYLAEALFQQLHTYNGAPQIPPRHHRQYVVTWHVVADDLIKTALVLGQTDLVEAVLKYQPAPSLNHNMKLGSLFLGLVLGRLENAQFLAFELNCDWVDSALGDFCASFRTSALAKECISLEILKQFSTIAPMRYLSLPENFDFWAGITNPQTLLQAMPVRDPLDFVDLRVIKRVANYAWN
ncbi:hypothetical protein H4R33_001297 [Dimargaris cristalligena]|nr:hypothetical protein H4R33_001297 [Dimargaris cristalligena]